MPAQKALEQAIVEVIQERGADGLYFRDGQEMFSGPYYWDITPKKLSFAIMDKLYGKEKADRDLQDK